MYEISLELNFAGCPCGVSVDCGHVGVVGSGFVEPPCVIKGLVVTSGVVVELRVLVQIISTKW